MPLLYVGGPVAPEMICIWQLRNLLLVTNIAFCLMNALDTVLPPGFPTLFKGPEET